MYATEGDSFEMEDQRNWTDASFKVYGTPLKNLSPVEVKTGTKISPNCAEIFIIYII